MNRADEFTRKLREQRGQHPEQVTTKPPPVASPPDSADEAVAAQAPTKREDTTDSETHLLPLEQIDIINPQHRKQIDPDSIRELATQIDNDGLYNPVLVRPVGSQRYELVQGERRYRAYQLLLQQAPDDSRWHSIRATVRDMDDFEKSLAQLAENIQREAMCPLDEAVALQRMRRDYQEIHGKILTMQSLGERIGKSKIWISRRLALLDKPAEIQQAVMSGALSLEQAAKRETGTLNNGNDSQPRARLRPVARVDFEALQGSVKALARLAELLDLPNIEIHARAARKDYVVAFELRAKEILNATVQRLKSE